MSVITRFAPSPTGFLHIGSARTALFNWLFARHHNGKFLLRIEDTDRERSTPEAVEAILTGLTWMGLTWDDKAIFQYERAKRHQEVARALVDKGAAYYCYTSPEELFALREEARANNQSFRYQSPWRWKKRSDFVFLWIIIFISLSGFLWMTLRTACIDTYMINKPFFIYVSKGHVVNVVSHGEGYHMDIFIDVWEPCPQRNSLINKEDSPFFKKRKRHAKSHWVRKKQEPLALREGQKIRIKVYETSQRQVKRGDSFKGKMRLTPLLDNPGWGGFHQRRVQFYQGIGGYGSFVGDPVWTLSMEGSRGGSFFARARSSIEETLQNSLTPLCAAVGSALIIGNQYPIPQWVQESFRKSGLSHVLAISGLHMSLIGGLIFFSVRALLRRFKSHGMIIYGEKMAAVLSIFLSFLYLGVSGFSVSALRAFLMTCLVLFALSIHRQGLSLRFVALAALAVLIWWPQSLLSPSFSLSFAAVSGLISAYEWINRTRFISNRKKIFKPWCFKGLIMRFFEYLGGIFISSLVATISTLPLVLYYFHSLSIQGLISNFIGIPLVAFWILPCAFLGTLLIPTGFSKYFYKLMGLGIEGLVFWAHAISQIPHTILYLPHPPDSFLPLCIGGSLWLIIWQRPWRYWGIIGMLMAVSLWFWAPIPAVFIDYGHHVVGIKDKDILYGIYLYDRKELSKEKSLKAPPKFLTRWANIFGCSSARVVGSLGHCPHTEKGCVIFNDIWKHIENRGILGRLPEERLELNGLSIKKNQKKEGLSKKKKNQKNFYNIKKVRQRMKFFTLTSSGYLEERITSRNLLTNRPWDNPHDE